MSRQTWQQRARRGAALAIITVAMLGTSANAAETPPGPRDTRVNACPPESVPSSQFTDTSGNTFEHEIDCLAWYGITTGGPGSLPASQYGPSLSVSRAQMASFIARFIDYVDDTLLAPYDGQNQFTDVANNNTHVAAINRLADAGVVMGGAGGAPANTYSPSAPVRRDQMSSFIARSIGFIYDDTNICANVVDYFDDDNGNTHEACINALADIEVVAGTATPGAYNPSGNVTRAQMAGFVMRSMDVLVEQQVTSPPAAG